MTRPDDTRLAKGAARPHPHARQERGRGRHEGLQAHARDQRRRLQGRGEGQGHQLHPRLLAPGLFPLPEGVTAEVDAKQTRLIVQWGRQAPARPHRGQDPRPAAARAVQGQGHQVRRARSSAARKARPARHKPRHLMRRTALTPAQGGAPWRSTPPHARSARRASARSCPAPTERPRLTVYKSLKHMYAQIVDDTTGTDAGRRLDGLEGAQGRGEGGRQDGGCQEGGRPPSPRRAKAKGIRGRLRSQRLRLPRPHRGGRPGGPRGAASSSRGNAWPAPHQRERSRPRGPRSSTSTASPRS